MTRTATDRTERTPRPPADVEYHTVIRLDSQLSHEQIRHNQLRKLHGTTIRAAGDTAQHLVDDAVATSALPRPRRRR